MCLEDGQFKFEEFGHVLFLVCLHMLRKFANDLQSFFDAAIDVRFSWVSVYSKNVGNRIFILDKVPTGSEVRSKFVTARLLVRSPLAQESVFTVNFFTFLKRILHNFKVFSGFTLDG